MKNNLFSGDKLFFLVATHGLPLDIAVGKIFNAGFTIDWVGFIDAALAGGWQPRRILTAIECSALEAISDNDYCHEVIVRVKLYLINKVL